MAHVLEFDGPLLTKRYRSWDRGEHRREWAVLQRIHIYHPDLCPRPVSASLDTDPVLLQQKPPDTVLGHRDPYLLNYLWDGSRVRLVDFEDSCLSDPATEVAILIEHLSTRDSGLHPDLFAVDPVRLLAARRLWAMFWLWRLLPGGPSADRNPPGTADLQAQRLLQLLS